MKKSDGIVIGGLMVFVGIISIPYTIRFIVSSSESILSFLVFLIFSIMPIGVGLFLVYATLRFKKSTVDEIGNAQPGTVPAPDDAVNIPKRIVINVFNNCTELSAEGMSPQEIVSSLEVAKYYVISKYVGHGSPVDIVRRK